MNFSQKSLVSVFGKFTGAFLALLSSVFLARFLGVSGIGQYQLIISIQVISITILAMGFGNATIFFINNKGVSKNILITNILKVFSIIALFYVAILGFSLHYYSLYFGQLRYLSIIVFALGSAALLLFNLMLPVLYVSLEVVKIQILNLLSTLILLLGVVLFYNFAIFNINVVLILAGISNIIPFIFLIFFLKDDINFEIKVDLKLLKSTFIYGVKLSATNLVFLLSSNLVIFLIKGLLDNGFEAVGLFSRATAIANMFVLIPSSIGPLLYSKWSSKSSFSLHVEVEKTLRILSMVSISSVLFILFFGKIILRLLYGVDFLPAQSALNIMSFSILFSTIVIVLTNLFSSIGKPLITLKIFVFSLIISTIIGIVLIPGYNILGASISVLSGIIFNALLLMYFAKKEINLDVFSSIFIEKKDLAWLLSNLQIKK